MIELDLGNVDEPRQRLYQFAQDIEPRSTCCNSSISWFYCNGFGSSWLLADYGRCNFCERTVNLNGVEK